MRITRVTGESIYAQIYNFRSLFKLAKATPGLANGPMLIASAPSPGAPGAVPYNAPTGYYYGPGNAYHGGYANTNPYYQNYPVYGNYPYGNPYYSPYVGRYNINGVNIPVFGAPQPLGSNLYGVTYGGAPYQFWRAPSGFYYPWAGGYNYNQYPILVMPPSSSTPVQTLPPVTTVVSDLDSYLNRAKEEGKISNENYVNLRERAHNILNKAQDDAQANGGTIDPDQEADLRRDVENLSAEVAYRVKP